MTVSVFDDPILSLLFGQGAVSPQSQIDIDAMIAFEVALAKAEAACGVISDESAEAIARAAEDFTPDISTLRQATARDGVVVPEFVRQFRAYVGEPHNADLHFGATSQDVTDTALVLALLPRLDAINAATQELAAAISDLERRFGDASLTGVTRMQEAIPITARDRLRAWRMPLERHAEAAADVRLALGVVQLGGAAGTLDKLGDQGAAVRAHLAGELGLIDPGMCWHNQRDNVARFGGWLAAITGSVGKIGQDIALMAQNSMGEIALSGGGGSSAMPHKQNPVAAEIMVALARYNAGQVSVLNQALIHEMERSGAAWSLEWLALSPMVAATEGALARAAELIGGIKRIGVADK